MIEIPYFVKGLNAYNEKVVHIVVGQLLPFLLGVKNMN